MTRRALLIALPLLALALAAVTSAEAAPSRPLPGGSTRVDGAPLQPTTTRLEGAQLLGRVNQARASAGLAPLLKAPEGRIELSILRLVVPEAPTNFLALRSPVQVLPQGIEYPFAYAHFRAHGAPDDAHSGGQANLHLTLAPGKLHVIDCRVEAVANQPIEFEISHPGGVSILNVVDGHVFAAFKSPSPSGELYLQLSAKLPLKKSIGDGTSSSFKRRWGWYLHGCEIVAAE